MPSKNIHIKLTQHNSSGSDRQNHQTEPGKQNLRWESELRRALSSLRDITLTLISYELSEGPMQSELWLLSAETCPLRQWL